MIRSVKSWKGIAIVWLFSLSLVSLVAIPMKSALKSGLGNSMITEKLENGINVEVFADLGAVFKSVSSYFSSGLFMALVIGFVINSFLAGGLFDSMKVSGGTFKPGEFFRASAKNFWSFVVISFVINLIIIILAILIIVIPVSIVFQSEISSEGTVFKTTAIAASFFLLVLTLMLLVADYARAWQVKNDKIECFKALGFGFSHTFRTFLSSYPLMLILLICQLLYGWLFFCILQGFMPAAGGGIVLLFLLTQMLFFIKILLKVWRYGSVTRMMELTCYPIV